MLGACTNTNIQELVNEVKFYPDINQSSALNIKLKRDSRIEFSNTSSGRPNLFNNYAVLNSGTSFDFKEMDYKVDTKELDGYIENFTLNLQRGSFSTTDCSFDMGMSSSVILKNVSFHNTISNSIIDASSGIIEASISNGSYININSIPVNNKLLLQDNSRMNVLGFKLSINEQNNSIIEIGNGSKFSLKVSQGTLSFGSKGFINIVNSELDAELRAVFESGQPPSVFGRISRFNVTTSSGELYPNEVSKIMIGSGNIHSNELFINSSAAPYITGTYDNFIIDVRENSLYAIPNGGLKIITDFGGKISAQDSGNPLRFTTGVNFPTGSFDMNLPFRSFVNSTFKKIALFDGVFKGKFDYDINNSIYGSNILTTGTLLLDVQLDQGHKTVPINFDIDKASLTYNNGRPQLFAGSLSIRISPTPEVINITTPPSGHINDHDAARIYPLNLLIGLKEPITIGPTPISFSGTSISLNIATNIVTNLVIPTGCGEYQGDDFVPQNCTHDGPDWAKNLQELGRDKVLTSTIHIYLFNRAYAVDAGLNINFDNNEGKLIVNLTNLKNRSEIAFNTDGGGIFRLVGDFLAFLFNGICDILPFIDCNVTSPSNAIDKAISSQIAKRIQQFNATWAIKVER